MATHDQINHAQIEIQKPLNNQSVHQNVIICSPLDVSHAILIFIGISLGCCGFLVDGKIGEFI